MLVILCVVIFLWWGIDIGRNYGTLRIYFFSMIERITGVNNQKNADRVARERIRAATLGSLLKITDRKSAQAETEKIMRIYDNYAEINKCSIQKAVEEINNSVFSEGPEKYN